MLKRPKPKALSAEAMQNIISASAQQTGSTKREKSYDPDFPAFSIPVNKKLLVYIPNHVVTLPDGTVDIRKDKFAAHTVKNKNFYSTIRCTAGIVDESLKLDGTCPFCDAVSEVWDLFNKQYSEAAKIRGISLDDPNAKDLLKAERDALNKTKAVGQGEVWYTFPIVVIDCEEQNGKLTTTPKKTDDGKINGKVYWYSVRERTYKEKWEKGLETVSTDNDIPPVHPAGLWAVLNFEYDSKSGKHDVMGSAKALAVGYKTMKADYKPWEEYFDKLTEDWTPVKAMETLVDNTIRDGQEQAEACDEVMTATRDKLAMYEMSGSTSVQTSTAVGGADAVLGSFGAVPTEQGALPTSEAPQVGIG